MSIRALVVVVLTVPWLLAGRDPHLRAQTSSAAPALRQRLDAAVPKLLRAHKVPSVAIAHISGGSVDLVAAYGERTAGVPALPSTIYNGASLAKPLAAETYLRFASQKNLPLDTSMALVWVDPDLANDARTKLLTPRLALSHRTGLPNWRYQTGGVLKFNHDPGRRFGYSGEGFEYLHAYLDRVSGAPLQTLAKTLVFDPIGMTETRFGWHEAIDATLATPSADGKWLEPDRSPKVLAADNVHTTAHDYAKFLAAITRGGGMSAELRSQQTRVQVDRKGDLCRRLGPSECPSEAGFGLGWEVFSFPDTTILMHTGSDKGESAIAIIDLARRDALVLLSNSNRGLAVVVDLLDVLGLDSRLVTLLKNQ